MASIVIAGDTSGTVTLAAPATAGTTTLTLPTTDGTVLTTTSPKAGNVLQVVNATYSTEVSTSSNTVSDTGITATITPTSATSKILCLVSVAGVAKSAANTQTNISLFLLRNSTSIIQFDYTALYTNTSLELRVGSISTNYLDSPATTSAITYKVQFNSNGSTGTTYVQRGSGGGTGATTTSTITLLEIAG
jgi:hypothetical protein